MIRWRKSKEDCTRKDMEKLLRLVGDDDHKLLMLLEKMRQDTVKFVDANGVLHEVTLDHSMCDPA